jgi:hypothetical protein
MCCCLNCLSEVVRLPVHSCVEEVAIAGDDSFVGKVSLFVQEQDDSVQVTFRVYSESTNSTLTMLQTEGLWDKALVSTQAESSAYKLARFQNYMEEATCTRQGAIHILFHDNEVLHGSHRSRAKQHTKESCAPC